jgi:hypothetical protein
VDDEPTTPTHSAEGSALGFYYQAFQALFTLLKQDSDNATVGIEQLDDIELTADGQKFLLQLKHSISAQPPAITIKSVPFWRTLKVWIDALPALSLSETTFHLVTVGTIPSDNPLTALTVPGSDRTELLEAVREEATRVKQARATAIKEEKKPIPYADRADGCAAFLALTETEQLNLLRRIAIQHGSASISAIEAEIANHLKILLPIHRPIVAERLVEWWDRQVVYSLCGKRDRTISRAELQQKIGAIVADIEQDKLLPDFETVCPPDDYQPAGMLARQIQLVDGTPRDISKATREEWRAREQRSKWINNSPAMAVTISHYDSVLTEYWSDKHGQMTDECAQLDDKGKRALGLKLLRWTHEEAPNTINPVSAEWSAAYYVRGSYQVLAINLTVGWHPDYLKQLEDAE